MSVEVEARRYLSDTGVGPSMIRSIQGARVATNATTLRVERPPFKHNFQHDNESFFWSLLWTISARINNQDLEAYASCFFRADVDCSRARETAMRDGLNHVKLACALPSPLKSLAKELECYRLVLFSAYKDRVSKAQFADVTTYSHLYQAARDVIDIFLKASVQPGVPRLITCCTHRELQSPQSRPSPEPGCGKRQHDPSSSGSVEPPAKIAKITRSGPGKREGES